MTTDNVFTEEMLAKKLSGFRKFAIISTVIILIFAGYVGAKSYLRATEILSDHSTVQATITRAEHWQEEGKKGNLKDIYEIRYSFLVEDKPYGSSFRTNEEKFIAYKAAGFVEIAYSNKNQTDFDRLELLQTQSSPLDLAKRTVILLIAVIAFFGVIGFLVKNILKKKIGKPVG